eukprot:3078310-Pyramimonas_sp.AAC.1
MTADAALRLRRTRTQRYRRIRFGSSELLWPRRPRARLCKWGGIGPLQARCPCSPMWARCARAHK